MDTADIIKTLNDTIENLRQDAERRELSNQETIRIMREDAAKKDAAIENLLKEITELRKKLDDMTSLLSHDNEPKNNTSPSDAESDGTPSSNASIQEISPSDSSSEDKGNKSGMEIEEESNDGFQPVRNKNSKKKRRINVSSDDESHPPKKTPAEPVKIIMEEAGKSNFIRQKTDDFPPLPTKTTSPITPVTPPKNTAPSVAVRPPRPKAIPPIVISNADKFNSISTLFRTNKIKYSSALVVRNGVKFFPCTETDYRGATQLLDKHKEPYFTFRFPEEKLNHVVLRGAPIHLTNKEIADDLISQGVSPKSIVRWKYSNGKSMPMVLVLVPKTDKTIFQIKLLCHFEVRAEAQKSKPRSIQCYNCQDHGHAAPCCHIPSRCVKCGENHHTSACNKAEEDPPKCANCQGDHPASFNGCPRHPSQIQAKKSTFKGWGTQDNSRLAPPKTPAPAQKQATVQAPVAPPLPEAQLAQIRQMLSEQMTTFMKTFLATFKP